MTLLGLISVLLIHTITSLEYTADLDSKKIKWKNDAFPNSIGSSHKDAMNAVKTILLSAWESSKQKRAIDTDETIFLSAQESSKQKRNQQRQQAIDQDDVKDCSSSTSPSGWSDLPDKYKSSSKYFDDNYPFWMFIGDIMVGTEDIKLVDFDGMIRLSVKDDKMSLVIHNSCKNKGNTKTKIYANCESNVEKHQGSKIECDDVNMLKVRLKVTKLGIQMPDFGLSGAIAWAIGDLPNGIHLQNLPYALSSLFPSNHEYEIQIQVGLSATATMSASGIWQMNREDVHVCSPGIELQGKLADGKVMSYVERNYLKKAISDNIQTPVYCKVKYTLPSIPWLGQILSFVAAENVQIEQQEDQEDKSIFSLSFDNLLETKPLPFRFDRLHLQTGFQFNLPTLKFIGEILESSSENAEKSSQVTDSQLSSKDERLLKRLEVTGFDRSVFDAIKEIEAYIAKLTKDTAEISTWLASVFDNIWNVLFTNGNDLEMMLKGGFAVGEDKQGENGGFTGRLDKLKVESITEKSPINMEIFFMDKLDIMAGLLGSEETPIQGVKRTDAITIHEPSDHDNKNDDDNERLIQLLKKNHRHRLSQGSGRLPPIEGVDQDNLFHMKGKVTLVEIEDGELSGTVRTLLEHRAKLNTQLTNLHSKIIQVLLNLIINHDVGIDIKTENDLPGADIDHVSVTTKRLELGGLISYDGPVSIVEALKAMKEILNSVAKLRKLENEKTEAIQNQQLNEWIAKYSGKKGECILAADSKFDGAKRVAMKKAEDGREMCENK